MIRVELLQSMVETEVLNSASPEIIKNMSEELVEQLRAICRSHFCRTAPGEKEIIRTFYDPEQFFVLADEFRKRHTNALPVYKMHEHLASEMKRFRVLLADATRRREKQLLTRLGVYVSGHMPSILKGEHHLNTEESGLSANANIHELAAKMTLARAKELIRNG